MRSESFLRWMFRASGPIGLVILGMSFYLVAAGRLDGLSTTAGRSPCPSP